MCNHICKHICIYIIDIYRVHTHRQQCGDRQKKRGMDIGGGGQRRKNGDKRDFASGDSYTMHVQVTFY